MTDEKPFEASAARLARAKREGDLPRSAELNALAAVVSAAAALCLVAPTLRAAVCAALARAVHSDVAFGPYALMAACVLVVYAGGLMGALTSTIAQAGALPFMLPVPRFAKLNPVSGLKRMFSRDAALAGVKTFVIASVLGVAIVPPMRLNFISSVRMNSIAAGAAGSPAALAAQAVRALEGAFAGALAAGGVFAAVDVLFERKKWKRRLRMSFEELKRDHRQSEGDPLLRGRRRAAHRTFLRGSIARLKEAAFVIANPTHVAIALEYRPPEVPVPRILVRAIDAGAREVKRRARALHIPVIENVTLARSLIAQTDVGDFIPPHSYGAIAAIVAALLREKTLVV